MGYYLFFLSVVLGDGLAGGLAIGAGGATGAGLGSAIAGLGLAGAIPVPPQISQLILLAWSEYLPPLVGLP